MNHFTRKHLLSLPQRDWQEEKTLYDSVLVFSSRKKHDSGWAAMVIVGCNAQVPVEICGQGCDDIEWLLPPAIAYDTFSIGQMRMDCLHPAAALHAWSRGGKFRVGAALSSVTIELLAGAA